MWQRHQAGRRAVANREADSVACDAKIYGNNVLEDLRVLIVKGACGPHSEKLEQHPRGRLEVPGTGDGPGPGAVLLCSA